jgi:hypothetical protein
LHFPDIGGASPEELLWQKPEQRFRPSGRIFHEKCGLGFGGHVRRPGMAELKPNHALARFGVAEPWVVSGRRQRHPSEWSKSRWPRLRSDERELVPSEIRSQIGASPARPRIEFNSVKFSVLCSALLAFLQVAPTCLATDYADLVAKGYRWSKVNGRYAFPSKEDAQRKASSGEPGVDLHQSDKGRPYYLIPGMVVLVLEQDSATGLSRIRAGGITSDLWTATKNLSTQPVRDTLGIIETPDSAAIVAFTSPSPTPGTNPNPAASMSPAPSATPVR